MDDFADVANFFPFPITDWENAWRMFGEMMADYKKLCNRRSGFQSNFVNRMAEEMQSLSTHTYLLMLYLHGFLEKDQSLLDTCLSYHPQDVFSESTSGAPRPLETTRGGADTKDQVGKGVNLQ